MRVSGRSLSVASLAAALTVGVVGAGFAQDATPTATGGAPVAGAFANHLHLGTCDDLDPQPAVALADLTFPDWVASMAGEADADDVEVVIPEPEDFGNAPIPVAVATTEVAVALADIVAGGHALNVHNPDDPGIYVACGNVGGVADERGDLFIGLAPVEDSGFSGVAWLHDNGGNTTVVVFLSHPSAQTSIDMSLAAMAAAAEAEAATPMAGAEATPEAAPDATPVT
jgi:hypothetical protein